MPYLQRPILDLLEARLGPHQLGGVTPFSLLVQVAHAAAAVDDPLAPYAPDGIVCSERRAQRLLLHFWILAGLGDDFLHQSRQTKRVLDAHARARAMMRA